MYGKFFRNVLPAMLAFVFSGLYTIVDGFFIGQNTGDIGLAAITIAYPLSTIVLALGTGIGMGGAVQISLCKGRNDKAGEENFLAGTLILIIISSVFTTLLILFGAQPFMRFMGTEGAIFDGGVTYLRTIAIGATFQLCATGMIPLLRSAGAALLAMYAMAAGFITNIVLDAMFVAVFKWGMAGAALATVVGQFVMFIPCLCYLMPHIRRLSKKALAQGTRLFGKILVIAISPFGLTICPSIVIAMINNATLSVGGDPAVAAYAVVAYVICTIHLLLQGVGDGSQPLISMCAGRGDLAGAIRIRNLAYGFSVIVAAAMALTIGLLGAWFPPVFGTSPQVGELATHGFHIVVFELIFVAISRTTTSYFYATGKNRQAYVIVYGQVPLLWLGLSILPRFFGLTGVWWSMPLSHFLLAGISVILLWLTCANEYCK